MARRNDKDTGLIFLVGLVLVIIAKISEFVVENIVIIGAIVGGVLIIFAVKKFIKHQDSKRQKELNIHNAILKGLNQKYEKEKSIIESKKEKIFQSFREIENDLISLEQKSETFNNSYDPIKAIFKLQNILKTNTINSNEIWDLLYNQEEYKSVNPNKLFQEKIKSIEKIEQLEYFHPKEIKDKRSEEVEKKKNDLNQSIKSRYNTSIDSIENRISELKSEYGRKGEEWNLEYENFLENQKLENAGVDLLKSKYKEKYENSIAEYHQKILGKITYDPNFHKSIAADYNKENNILVIEYLLPTIKQFPKNKGIPIYKNQKRTQGN